MFPETFNFNDLALCHLCVSGIGALQPCGIVPTNMERSPTDPRRMALHVGHSVPFVAGTLETMSRSGLFNSLYSRLCAATMWVNAVGRDGVRVMEAMRWGFPPPPNLGKRPVTNVRNVASPYWRGWLKPEFRCLVPATSFCEYTDSQPKVPHWFALAPDRPAFAFAGIWRSWTGTRKSETGEHLLFAFLTTEPNEVVRPVHAKAMPVILTAETWDVWLAADTVDALRLQRPFLAERMVLVATGARQDGQFGILC
jgi:putative SOS response-associated peptidase YedK